MASLLKHLFTLTPLAGHRTHIAAAGALAGAVYFLAQKDFEKAGASLVAFLGLVGLRGKADPPADPTPAATPSPAPFRPSLYEAASRAGVNAVLAVVLLLSAGAAVAQVPAPTPPPTVEQRLADLEAWRKRADAKLFPPAPPKPKFTPAECPVRIQFGANGCTACPILPRRADGRWDLLTANHCVPGVGGRGTVFLADGRRLAVRVSAAEYASDIAWLVTEAADIGELPALELAPALPPRNTPVWHKGFGVDRPGSREDGEVIGPTADGKLAFVLSVSSGDSGGPIITDSSSRVVASVCCTSAMAQKAVMYGGHCVRAAQLRPAAPALFDASGGPPDAGWAASPVPVCPVQPTALLTSDELHELNYREVLARVAAGGKVVIRVGADAPAAGDEFSFPARFKGIRPAVYDCYADPGHGGVLKARDGRGAFEPDAPAPVSFPAAPVRLTAGRPTCPTCR